MREVSARTMRPFVLDLFVAFVRIQLSKKKKHEILNTAAVCLHAKIPPPPGTSRSRYKCVRVELSRDHSPCFRQRKQNTRATGRQASNTLEQTKLVKRSLELIRRMWSTEGSSGPPFNPISICMKEDTHWHHRKTVVAPVKRFPKTKLGVPLTRLNIIPPLLHTVTLLRHARLDSLCTVKEIIKKVSRSLSPNKTSVQMSRG